MKKAVSLFVLFILVSSLFALAEDTAVTTPTFWEKVSIWLFGTPTSSRANLVGEASATNTATLSVGSVTISVDCTKYPSQCDKIKEGNNQINTLTREIKIEEAGALAIKLKSEIDNYIKANPNGESISLSSKTPSTLATTTSAPTTTQSAPTITISPEARQFMTQNNIEIKDGYFYFKNKKQQLQFEFTPEKLKELERSPTNNVEAKIVNGELLIITTDTNGKQDTVGYSASSGARVISSATPSAPAIAPPSTTTVVAEAPKNIKDITVGNVYGLKDGRLVINTEEGNRFYLINPDSGQIISELNSEQKTDLKEFTSAGIVINGVYKVYSTEEEILRRNKELVPFIEKLKEVAGEETKAKLDAQTIYSLAQGYTDSSEENKIYNLVINENTDLSKVKKVYENAYGKGSFKKMLEDELSGEMLNRAIRSLDASEVTETIFHEKETSVTTASSPTSSLTVPSGFNPAKNAFSTKTFCEADDNIGNCQKIDNNEFVRISMTNKAMVAYADVNAAHQENTYEVNPDGSLTVNVPKENKVFNIDANGKVTLVSSPISVNSLSLTQKSALEAWLKTKSILISGEIDDDFLKEVGVTIGKDDSSEATGNYFKISIQKEGVTDSHIIPLDETTPQPREAAKITVPTKEFVPEGYNKDKRGFLGNEEKKCGWGESDCLLPALKRCESGGNTCQFDSEIGGYTRSPTKEATAAYSSFYNLVGYDSVSADSDGGFTLRTKADKKYEIYADGTLVAGEDKESQAIAYFLTAQKLEESGNLGSAIAAYTQAEVLFKDIGLEKAAGLAKASREILTEEEIQTPAPAIEGANVPKPIASEEASAALATRDAEDLHRWAKGYTSSSEEWEIWGLVTTKNLADLSKIIKAYEQMYGEGSFKKMLEDELNEEQLTQALTMMQKADTAAPIKKETPPEEKISKEREAEIKTQNQLAAQESTPEKLYVGNDEWVLQTDGNYKNSLEDGKTTSAKYRNGKLIVTSTTVPGITEGYTVSNVKTAPFGEIIIPANIPAPSGNNIIKNDDPNLIAVLKALGYDPDGIIYSKEKNKVAAALKSYQEEHELTVDGDAGKNTIAALNRELESTREFKARTAASKPTEQQPLKSEGSSLEVTAGKYSVDITTRKTASETSYFIPSAQDNEGSTQEKIALHNAILNKIYEDTHLGKSLTTEPERQAFLQELRKTNNDAIRGTDGKLYLISSKTITIKKETTSPLTARLPAPKVPPPPKTPTELKEAWEKYSDQADAAKKDEQKLRAASTTATNAYQQKLKEYETKSKEYEPLNAKYKIAEAAAKVANDNYEKAQAALTVEWDKCKDNACKEKLKDAPLGIENAKAIKLSLEADASEKKAKSEADAVYKKNNLAGLEKETKDLKIASEDATKKANEKKAEAELNEKLAASERWSGSGWDSVFKANPVSVKVGNKNYWVDSDGKVYDSNRNEITDSTITNNPDIIKASKEVTAREKILKGRQKIWEEGDNPLGHTVSAITGFAQQLGKYQGLSNLLMPDITKQWMDVTNSAFFKTMDVIGAASKSACDYDQRMSAKIPGQNAVFIETISGTYQFVGKIQAERSSSKTFILCQPQTNACPSTFVCKQDLCYETEDSETPVKGYLYKIDWGITAPQDEKQTPYIDENHKAVKFNVMLKYNNRNVWLYKRQNVAPQEVIQLTNGESDHALFMKYLAGEAEEACVKFSDTAYPLGRYGSSPIHEICADIKSIERGEVDFNKETYHSNKVSSGEVTETSDVW